MFTLFFFNDTATTEIYTLSLHDALPISPQRGGRGKGKPGREAYQPGGADRSHRQRPRGGGGRLERSIRTPWLIRLDRKSTRLNSSHLGISYAVFCLKKKTLLFCRRPR